jgi:hypothetical protein
MTFAYRPLSSMSTQNYTTVGADAKREDVEADGIRHHEAPSDSSSREHEGPIGRPLPGDPAALGAFRFSRFCWRQKRALVELLQIEAWGSRNARCHRHHFLELCAFLDIDVEALTSQEPKAYTQAYLERRLALCLDPSRPVVQGLAAIALGNENPESSHLRSLSRGH